MSSSSSSSVGNYIPENYTVPEDPEKQNFFLKSTFENIARNLNRKDTGQYENIEVQNNQTFPGINPQTKNFIFRKVISTGALPNTATSSVAHNIPGISSSWTFTRIFGTAKDLAAVRSIPLPNGGPSYEVQIDVDATNVNITTSANLTAFTESQVVLEYFKG